VLNRLKERARSVLQLDDPTWRIALALAIGVFISCTPTFGFQTLIALGLAWVTRLSRAAMVLGVWINLPWVTPFVYAAALQLGSFILSHQPGFGGFWLMLVVGTTIIGAAAAVVTYVVSYGALSRRRRALTAQAPSNVDAARNSSRSERGAA
jgi:uncharacterized protein (DUF2062 family)